MCIKNFPGYLLCAVILLVMMFNVSCNYDSGTPRIQRDDAEAKQLLQGTWINDLDGNIVFTFRGDTVFYDDSLATPVAFHVYGDTLYIDNHTFTAYPISKLNASEFCFINSDGDNTTLVKAEKGVVAPLANGEYRGAVALNQGRKVKHDTVMVYKDKHYHAYTQVNPTTYKVYKQRTNSDGLRVESVYYDNIIHIALYEGRNKLHGSNITKAEFTKLVPAVYIEQAVLSDIYVSGVSDKGVEFVAVLSIPDSYTNYRVKINIDPQGRKTLSL